MSKKVNPQRVTPVFIGNFPALFEPKLNNLNKKMEYSVIACFPKGTNITELQQTANDICIEAWGPDTAKWPKPGPGKAFGNPFRKGEEKRKTDETTGKTFIPPPHEEGAYWMTLRTEKKPGVVNQQVQKIMDSSEIYSGVKLQASIRFFAYNKAGNVGVSAGLVNIQKVADGEPLGGATRAEDDFAPIAVENNSSVGTKTGAPSIFG